MNNTLSKVEKENPCRRVPSPDGVVAYHAALSRLRPGFKSRSGRHSSPKTILPPVGSLFRTWCLQQYSVDLNVSALHPSTAQLMSWFDLLWPGVLIFLVCFLAGLLIFVGGFDEVPVPPKRANKKP